MCPGIDWWPIVDSIYDNFMIQNSEIVAAYIFFTLQLKLSWDTLFNQRFSGKKYIHKQQKSC